MGTRHTQTDTRWDSMNSSMHGARALGQAALRVRNLLRNRAARPVHVYAIHNNNYVQSECEDCITHHELRSAGQTRFIPTDTIYPNWQHHGRTGPTSLQWVKCCLSVSGVGRSDFFFLITPVTNAWNSNACSYPYQWDWTKTASGTAFEV